MTTPKLSFKDIFDWFIYHRTMFGFIAGLVCGFFTYFVSAEEFKVYIDKQEVVNTSHSKAISIIDYELRLVVNRAEQEELIDGNEILTPKQARKLDRLMRDEERYENKLNES